MGNNHSASNELWRAPGSNSTSIDEENTDAEQAAEGEAGAVATTSTTTTATTELRPDEVPTPVQESVPEPTQDPVVKIPKFQKSKHHFLLIITN